MCSHAAPLEALTCQLPQLGAYIVGLMHRHQTFTPGHRLQCCTMDAVLPMRHMGPNPHDFAPPACKRVSGARTGMQTKTRRIWGRSAPVHHTSSTLAS